MAWTGAPVRFAAPRDALAVGLTVIYQELSLVPQLGADANIFLGMEPVRRGVLDRRAAVERAHEALRALGAEFDPRTPAGDLSVAERQLVELARALVREAPAHRPRRADGHAVAPSRRGGCSSRSDGSARGALRSSSCRTGWKRSGASPTRSPSCAMAGACSPVPQRRSTTPGLIRHMVGRDVEYARLPLERFRPSGEPLLEARGSGQGPRLRRRIAPGAARRDRRPRGARRRGQDRGGPLPRGSRCPGRRNHVRWPARRTGRPRHGTRSREGVVYLPEDRKTQGLVLGMSVRENVTLATLRKFSTVRRHSAARRAEAAARQTAAVELRPPDIEREAGTLSGGNQQKVVLAKWLLADADLLIIDEPTRGVDVATKAETAPADPRARRRGKGDPRHLLRIARDPGARGSHRGDAGRRCGRRARRIRGHRRAGARARAAGVSRRMSAPRAARFGVPMALAGLVLVAGLLIPGFISRANLTTILLHVSINGIIALGCTFVIITAGIDLSVGSVVGLAGVLTAATLTSGEVLRLLGPVGAAVAAGVVGIAAGAAVGPAQRQRCRAARRSSVHRHAGHDDRGPRRRASRHRRRARRLPRPGRSAVRRKGRGARRTPRPGRRAHPRARACRPVSRCRRW